MKRVGISLILLTLIVPLGLASTAWAGDKEDVAAAAAKWADAFSAETPDRVLALYDREAVLWEPCPRSAATTLKPFETTWSTPSKPCLSTKFRLATS